jgi:hypothetical protein
METKIEDNEIVSWERYGLKHTVKRADGSVLTSEDGMLWNLKHKAEK